MLKYLSTLITGYDLAKYRPGLGPNCWGYLRIFIPFAGLFYNPSETHDLGYIFGGNEEDRRLSDEVFWAECRAKCKNSLQKMFASIYYKSLRNFGRYYFNYL